MAGLIVLNWDPIEFIESIEDHIRDLRGNKYDFDYGSYQHAVSSNMGTFFTLNVVMYCTTR